MISFVRHLFLKLPSATGLLRRFCGDQSGGALLLVALSIIPLIGFIGIGTDSARGYLVRSRLSSALDAAALAGGRNLFLATRDDDIRMYFEANFPPGYLGTIIEGPVITVDEDAETVQLTATATISTTFMSIFGFSDLTIAASAEVTRAQEALDLVLAIDMSGSMGGSRITAARNAATELVNILFGSDASNDLLSIGLVPWNGKVNITLNGTAFNSGDTVSQVVANFLNPETGAAQSVVYFANNSPVPLLAAPDSNWQGCVFSRYLDDGDTGNDADVLLPPQSVGTSDWPAWQPIGPEGEPVSGGTCTLAANGSECRPCLHAGITPLQNAKQPVLDAIASLTNPAGTTNIPQGLGWAWRVLKPISPFTEAIADPPYQRTQAIVLLTDGENYAGSGDGYKTVFGYGSSGRPEMNERLLEIAGNIKADNVLLYVIQFANSGTALQTLLRQVASAPDTSYYYFAPDTATLQTIFRQIANQLSSLRLSK